MDVGRASEVFLKRLRSMLPSRSVRPAVAPSVLIAIVLAAAAHSQSRGADFPADLAPLSRVPVLNIPAVAVAARETPADSSASGGPFLFADPFAVAVDPATHGRWEVANEGRTAVWRLRVVSGGAVSLNFGFTRYRMPPGGRLRLYAPDGIAPDGIAPVGPFTSADNESHGELWTPLVSGSEIVIEVALPADRQGDLELELGSVNRGFR